MYMLSQNAHFAVGVTRSTSSTSTISTSPYDMSGYDGIVALSVHVTANSGNKLKAQMAATTSSTAMEDLTGTALGVGSSDEQQYLDVYRPTKRYVRFQLLRSGAATLADGIWVIRYGARNAPTSINTAGTIFGEAHASPTTGTA